MIRHGVDGGMRKGSHVDVALPAKAFQGRRSRVVEEQTKSASTIAAFDTEDSLRAQSREHGEMWIRRVRLMKDESSDSYRPTHSPVRAQGTGIICARTVSCDLIS